MSNSNAYAIRSKAVRALAWSLTVVLAACAPVGTRNEPVVVVASESGVTPALVPEGETITLTLDEKLGVDESRPGDGFSATVAEPVLVSDRVVVPAGAKVYGHVTAVQDADDSEQDVDVIKLHFTRLSLDSESYPLDVELVEANPTMESNRSTGEKIAGVAGGAAAGAILGRIISGDDVGTLVGAAVGAAAGTAIVMGTADQKAVLPKGSVMRVRTLSPVRVAV